MVRLTRRRRRDDDRPRRGRSRFERPRSGPPVGWAWRARCGRAAGREKRRRTPLKKGPDTFSFLHLFFPDTFSFPPFLSTFSFLSERGTLFGTERWVKRTAPALGLESSLNPPGRPPKRTRADGEPEVCSGQNNPACHDSPAQIGFLLPRILFQVQIEGRSIQSTLPPARCHAREGSGTSQSVTAPFFAAAKVLPSREKTGPR